MSVLIGAVAGHLADRMRAAAADAEASARHFELAGDLLGTATFEGRFTHLNGAWERCLGWTREELMARPFLDFVHPEDRASTEAEAARATEGDGSVCFTNRYRTKDGRRRTIEWRSWIDPERQLIHAAARDVTERAVAEAAQREAEERFRRAFDDSATGMAVVGVDGERRDVLLDANDSLGRIFGCPREQLARDLQEVAAQRLAGVVGDAHGPITFSVGLVEIGEGTSADELLSLADRALYAAKAAGRDRVVAERDVDGDLHVVAPAISPSTATPGAPTS